MIRRNEEERKLYKTYDQHRSNARVRGIEFLLTFEEWVQIWNDSGLLHLRGQGKGKYCMARFGDKGPYVVGNVKIITHSQNSFEMNQNYPDRMLGKRKAHTAETKRKLSLARTGYRVTEETKKLMSLAKKGRKFPNMKAAALRRQQRIRDQNKS